MEARYTRLVQLFTDKGIQKFEDFVYQNMEDKKEEFDLAEQCIDLAGEIRFRAQFDTCLKAFFDSLDLLFNVDTADRYYIPAKRFGYLLMRIRNRYRDETMDLKWAGEKVRKLIDKYLLSLGIDSKIPPVPLLSDKFPKELDKQGKSSKAKASEMEHAMRRHIKVNMNNDPQLYTKFNDRLKAILEKHRGNWDVIVEELDALRTDMKTKNQDLAEGLDEIEDVFYRNIVHNAFKKEKNTTDAATKETSVHYEDKETEVKKLVVQIVKLLRERLQIPNFWKGRPSEAKKLEGEIDDLLDFSGIVAIADTRERICADILSLAQKGNMI